MPISCPCCKLFLRALTSHRTEHREGFLDWDGLRAWHHMWDQLYCTAVQFPIWFKQLCTIDCSTVWIWCIVFTQNLAAFLSFSSSKSPSDPSSVGKQSFQIFYWSSVFAFCWFGIMFWSLESFRFIVGDWANRDSTKMTCCTCYYYYC